ncbi:MAG: ABC transporter ATP-binding protein [Corynebacterium sp.]|uniref:ABC transporter ATP-binding protein n=1 Tax=unclassified Corynebacterium TaxID=2624378 RepID=UPI00264761CD|nr:ABC transporter ATP-binding protein [Corynebacterium sp.]MDN5581990.1 ABC transporter ATP-binding protein [Corynebacterium sp.]MDN5720069.1 ABC transporter ATP-binding protein [Corynebacterium sp.]MDN6258443.1 ABC transporter ATP-binding protein [Corynebacterium sp.]MDN6324097.1 ABC transporter ATP-binding protein [Corynebacterium sp.]MDN6510578.1 ABC transporter ATP-binding protein [Corynebacterium sp.]
MSTAPVISVTDLTRTYQAKKSKDAYTAVKGISFDVDKGEVYGLLGTNGAGKTSTLEIVEGLAAPSQGTVRVLGMDPVADRARIRPELGIMLQSGGLPKELTVAETMRMWAGTCSTPLPVDDVLGEVDLNHRTDVRVGSLSGGEQRRLDLACALLNDPGIVILDEPTTGLDPESRARTWELLAALKDRGVTMILTTHYLEEAEHLADRIAIMDAGVIAVEGRLDDLAATEGAEISFTLPDAGAAGGNRAGRPQDVFPSFPGAQVTRDGVRLRIETSRLQEDTHRLLDWAAANDVTLGHFSARPASLERVFAKIAGRDSTV